MRDEPFSERVASHLRVADRRLRTTDPLRRHRRYAVVRIAMSNIAQVDSFFIGFFLGETSLVIPYIVDHDVQLQPEVATIGPRSLSTWVRRSAKPYCVQQDDGALLSRTVPFGDESEISQDAVFAPLRDADTGEITGVVSVQSLAPEVFDDEAIRALEWLAEALMLSLSRDRVVSEHSSVYAAHPELNTAIATDRESRFARAMEGFQEAVTRCEALTVLARTSGYADLEADAGELLTTLTSMRAELAELLLERQENEPPPPEPPAALTLRELEIARLIAREGATNGELAERLGISPKTVKTHVGSILRKLGVAQRSAIVFALDDESRARQGS